MLENHCLSLIYILQLFVSLQNVNVKNVFLNTFIFVCKYMSQNIFMHIIFSKYMHVCVFKYTLHTYKCYVNKTFILDVINRLSALIRRNSQQCIV